MCTKFQFHRRQELVFVSKDGASFRDCEIHILMLLSWKNMRHLLLKFCCCLPPQQPKGRRRVHKSLFLLLLRLSYPLFSSLYNAYHCSGINFKLLWHEFCISPYFRALLISSTSLFDVTCFDKDTSHPKLQQRTRTYISMSNSAKPTHPHPHTHTPTARHSNSQTSIATVYDVVMPNPCCWQWHRKAENAFHTLTVQMQQLLSQLSRIVSGEQSLLQERSFGFAQTAVGISPLVNLIYAEDTSSGTRLVILLAVFFFEVETFSLRWA